MTAARGFFEVELKPESDDRRADGNSLGCVVVEKRFHGDLEGSGHGRMLTGTTRVEGSAGYVLIERVRGKLHGHSGTFLLQHWGVLNHGAAKQTIEILPDSGTGELAGLTGHMMVHIAGGKHSYQLEYTLPGR
ncbi:MAG: DUF3224 domain-containing protein [Thermoplasmata archaeon]